MTAVNDRLTADNNRLTAELCEVSDRAAKETELRQRCEEEVTRLKALVQVVEAAKQGLLQIKTTMTKSVDDCFSKLKLELNTAGNFYQPIQVI